MQLRKEFRPAFGKLDPICSIFPDVPIVALTATATKSKREKIVSSTGLQLPFVVEVNPNRENIFFQSQPRPAAKEERTTVLAPYVQELKARRSAMPLTILMGTWRAVLKAFYISALSRVIISMSPSMQTSGQEQAIYSISCAIPKT